MKDWCCNGTCPHADPVPAERETERGSEREPKTITSHFDCWLNLVLKCEEETAVYCFDLQCFKQAEIALY